MKSNILKYFRWIFLSSISGLLAGISSSIFLVLLSLTTETRNSNMSIMYLLPVAGFFIGYIYYKYGKGSDKGNNLILDEIHNPKKIIPLRMVPFVLFGTLLTHLFGGSAGREGTAVQMGGTLSDHISKYIKLTAYERKVLLIAGSGAGLGAAISTPWAGVIFGMEIITVGKLRLFAFFQCLIASFVGYLVVHFLKVPHTIYPEIQFPEFQTSYIIYLIIAGITFGLTANSFSRATHFITKVFKKYINYPPLRPFIGGVLIIILYQIEGTNQYAGLGLSTIQNSLIEQSHWSTALLKIFFTALTLGSGFKGGEFTPLVFIGATLGSALAFLTPIPFEILAAVGFVAVFGGAANAPIACTIMAIEIFGLSILPYALITCFMSYYFSGHNGIYYSQKYYEKKYQRPFNLIRLLGELPKRFISKP